MNRLLLIIFLFASVLIMSGCDKSNNPNEPIEENKTIVDHFGQLQINGRNVVDENGKVVVLRGMSLFWSQWGGRYYNEETIQWLRDDWKCTVVRAAMAVENGGYLSNPENEYQKIRNVIEACVELGIYVIIDWHDHRAEEHLKEAKTFFDRISSEYGHLPNLIYEIYNEPLDVSWNETIKPYAEAIVNTIRSNDPDNIIVVGTRNWSQDVEDVVNSEIESANISYSLHFYSSTHKQELRDKATQAINAGLPLFVSEWGMSESNGDGIIDNTSLNEWVDFLEANNLSWCNWSIVNKDETSAALLSSTGGLSGWSENELSESGRIIRDYLILMNGELFEQLNN